MNPRLLVLAGTSETETIQLDLADGESFSIGRSVECDLPVGSSAVSRKHCSITCTADSYELNDLGSHNGTFLNDMPVKQRVLADGDRISVGGSHLIFLTREEGSIPVGQARFDDDSLKTDSSSVLSPQPDSDEFSP